MHAHSSLRFPISCTALFLAAGLFLVGCNERPAIEHSAAESAPGPFVSPDKESPLLTERVRAGLLPPLAERLPTNPVQAPVFGPNALYGGTLRIVVDGYWSYGGIDNVFSSRLFFHLPETDSEGRVQTDENGNPKFHLAGILAESWEVSEDGKVVTVKLREGLRYSDGHLFTTEDIAYRWAIWNDTERYRSISPVPVVRLNDQPVGLEVVDDYTFRFLLPEPDFRWVESDAAKLQFWETPKHWISRYDPNINPAVTDWNEFKRNLGSFSNLNRPALGPWKIVKWNDSAEMIAERNPYFFMVDSEGRQLPYIDRVRGFMTKNPEVATMRVMSGLIDLYDKGQVQDLALLKASEKRGNYRLFFTDEGPGSQPGFIVNFFTERPKLAALLRDLRFRKALSLGIDREEINDLVFSGFGVPTSASFGPWFIDRYAVHDPERARELLAEIGLVDTNGDGVLEYPDGGDVTIVITTLPGLYTNVTELAASQWQHLGINAVVQNTHPHQYSVTRRTRTFDLIAAHNGSYNLSTFKKLNAWSPLSTPLNLERSEGKGIYEPFQRWHLSSGEQGQNPRPEILQALVRLHELEVAYHRELDPQAAEELARQVSEIWADHVLWIGTVGRVPTPFMVSNRLLNVPSVLWPSPDGFWLRSSLYPFQLVIAPEDASR